ncbi:MAG: hypothetical protein FWD57_07540, partial [Polyangiaceae bacterium]|nr:hypothetical protein [Polyangiaceae bacterium]
MEFGERTKAKSYGSLTPSRLRNLLGVGFGVSVCLLSGCATVGTGVPDIHDTYLRTEREVLLIPDRAEASVKQNGTEIVVRVRHVCRAKTQDVVSRTTRAQNFNATPGVTYSVAGLGALLGGLGTATIIDPSIMTTSTNGVEDEGGGSDATKRGVGVGLVGVGGILLVTALVDVIRTSGETEETFIAELEPTDLPGTVECAPHRTNYANATVSMTYRGESYELGNTDSSGALTVELDDVIAKDVVPEPKGTIAIIVNDSEVG